MAKLLEDGHDSDYRDIVGSVEDDGWRGRGVGVIPLFIYWGRGGRRIRKLTGSCTEHAQAHQQKTRRGRIVGKEPKGMKERKKSRVVDDGREAERERERETHTQTGCRGNHLTRMLPHS